MRTGRLTEYITVQEKVQTPDGAGGYDTSWNDVADHWATITPLRGAEQIQAEKETGATIYKIDIRNHSSLSLNTNHRIKWITNSNLLMNVREILSYGKEADWVTFHAEVGVVI